MGVIQQPHKAFVYKVELVRGFNGTQETPEDIKSQCISVTITYARQTGRRSDSFIVFSANGMTVIQQCY